jgi:hypothetical protein
MAWIRGVLSLDGEGVERLHESRHHCNITIFFTSTSI